MSDPLDFPTLLESHIIFQESLITVKKDRLKRNIKGREYSYYTLVTKPYAVVIIPLTSEGVYVLTQEYRHPTGKVLLGCPGGYLDPQESPLEGAKRELAEETGYTAERFDLLGSAFPYSGISSQCTVFVSAKNAKKTAEPALEPDEIICTVLKTPQELRTEILQGADLDGNLCTALFLLSQQY